MTAHLHAKQSYWHRGDLIFLILLALVCYWPLTFGVFSAKNDNIVAFLPVRFMVSESLRNGQLPLWSPYMYLGFPIHGDMQGGAWNPLVWFLSMFGRYNLTSMHCEILACIMLAGLGMYRMLGTVGCGRFTRLAGAAAFLMCGFITDVAGSNLPFLAAAAWSPFVFSYFLHLFKNPGWYYAIRSALALWLLLVCAYPSFFILACYILLAAIVILSNRQAWKGSLAQWKKQYLFAGSAIMLFLLISAPALLSYITILPFYNRVNGVSYLEAVRNSFHPGCALSMVLPAAPVKMGSVAATDLASRNTYFNIFLLVSCISLSRIKKSLLFRFTLAGVIFFLLFSLGDLTPVRKWCYDLLPLMDTFRHPSNARLLVIFGGIICGSLILDPFLEQKRMLKLKWHPGLFMMAGLTGSLIWSLLKGAPSHISQILPASIDNREALKRFFDELVFSDLVFIVSLIQLVFFTLFFMLARKKDGYRYLSFLLIANSFICAQIALPFTLVSKQQPGMLNQILRNYPKGFPMPDPAKTIGMTSVQPLQHFEELGITLFYTKQIGTTDIIFTPTFLTMISQAMKHPDTRKKVMEHPFAYYQKVNDTTHFTALSPHHFNANGFQFETNAKQAGFIYIQQAFLPGWQCTIDGRRTEIQGVNEAFMAVPVTSGSHEVCFVYRPRGLIFCLIISLASILSMFIVLLKTPRREE